MGSPSCDVFCGRTVPPTKQRKSNFINFWLKKTHKNKTPKILNYQVRENQPQPPAHPRCDLWCCPAASRPPKMRLIILAAASRPPKMRLIILPRRHARCDLSYFRRLGIRSLWAYAIWWSQFFIPGVPSVRCFSGPLFFKTPASDRFALFFFCCYSLIVCSVSASTSKLFSYPAASRPSKMRLIILAAAY